MDTFMDTYIGIPFWIILVLYVLPMLYALLYYTKKVFTMVRNDLVSRRNQRTYRELTVGDLVVWTFLIFCPGVNVLVLIVTFWDTFMKGWQAFWDFMDRPIIP